MDDPKGSNSFSVPSAAKTSSLLAHVLPRLFPILLPTSCSPSKHVTTLPSVLGPVLELLGPPVLGPSRQDLDFPPPPLPARHGHRTLLLLLLLLLLLFLSHLPFYSSPSRCLSFLFLPESLKHCRLEGENAIRPVSGSPGFGYGKNDGDGPYASTQPTIPNASSPVSLHEERRHLSTSTTFRWHFSPS